MEETIRGLMGLVVLTWNVVDIYFRISNFLKVKSINKRDILTFEIMTKYSATINNLRKQVDILKER